MYNKMRNYNKILFNSMPDFEQWKISRVCIHGKSQSTVYYTQFLYTYSIDLCDLYDVYKACTKTFVLL